MSFLLKLLPFQYYIAAGVFVALLAGIGVQSYRVNSYKADLSEAIALRAQEREASAEAARIQSEEYRLEDQRRASAIRSAIDHAIKTSEAVAVDAANARSAADRLRARVAAIVAASRKASGDPAAAPGSPPAQDATGVLAELYRRLDAAAELYAGVADATYNAGLTCERIGDEMRAKQ